MNVLTQQIYRVLGIRIILTSTLTFTTGDLFTVVSTPSPLLDAFTDFARVELLNTVQTCTLGQITQALYEVAGRYRRNM